MYSRHYKPYSEEELYEIEKEWSSRTTWCLDTTSNVANAFFDAASVVIPRLIATVYERDEDINLKQMWLDNYERAFQTPIGKTIQLYYAVKNRCDGLRAQNGDGTLETYRETAERVKQECPYWEGYNWATILTLVADIESLEVKDESTLAV